MKHGLSEYFLKIEQLSEHKIFYRAFVEYLGLVLSPQEPQVRRRCPIAILVPRTPILSLYHPLIIVPHFI
jgi:hypothetical protein